MNPYSVPPPQYPNSSGPHFEDPLAAPKPTKIDPDIPKNMARNLDEQLAQSAYHPGGFNIPGPQAPWQQSLLPTPPHNPSQSPAPSILPFPNYNPSSMTMAPIQQNNLRAVSPAPTLSNHVSHGSNDPPSLTAPLPTIPALSAALPTIQNPSHDPALRVAWVRDVLFLVDRASAQAGGSALGEPQVGPVTIHDPQLLRLTQVAVPIILQIADGAQAGTTLPAHIAEALYHRASLTASGAFPEHIQRNPRQAFRDFEQSARAGYGKAWFRIGRDYEGFGDMPHAKECFERGLLGQLTLPSSPETALPLLHRAALLSSIDTPQPAYVYALLLLGEFTQLQVDPALFFRLGLIPAQWAHSGGNIGLLQEARTHLEKSAYLHFAPAQYKLGHAYEFATPPFEFDALMSVEWYSRASQQGETEADMALSKWFLCGSRVGGADGTGAPFDPTAGGFDKDEQLARVFAEKAARKGLPSAEFAMGYYCEVGIGGVKDLDEAIAWYRKASAHANTDALERLGALEQPDGTTQMLSRMEHDNITESKLVRTRTQAKQRSEAQKVRDGYMAQQGPPQGPQQGLSPPPQGPYRPGPGLPQGPSPRRQTQDSRPVVELIRKNTLTNYQQQGQGRPVHAGTLPPGASIPGAYPGNNGPRPMSAQSQPLPGSGPGVGPRRPGQQAQAFPNANRYTLVDPGSGSASSGSPLAPRADSRSPSRAAGRPPMRRGASGAGSPAPGPGGPGGGYAGSPNAGPNGPAGAPPGMDNGAPPAPKPPGPQTFAEMGFTGAKVEDEKCVIM
ncbi:HCP-like protein [Gymnopus androsaceus JB14]|uniref:HCP-like protein n=1 Tax=Gymnopus androsaceus JB14 TaxID=1447944 RepID=A0A6A4HGN7_9AGAR|nr:HCP-like protein [Gymnopus androsaceus JB14]